MTTDDRGSSPDPPPPSNPQKSPTVINLPGDSIATFLVGITRNVWRLESALERSRTRGEAISDEIWAMVERMQEELQGLGLRTDDPSGQSYTPGMRVEIARLEPGGSGKLVIKRTVLAGVSLNGVMLRPANVIVGKEKTP